MGIAAGSRHSVALADDGAVYGWGRNSYGQLGMGASWNVRSQGHFLADAETIATPTLLETIGVGGKGEPTIENIDCFLWSTFLIVKEKPKR